MQYKRNTRWLRKACDQRHSKPKKQNAKKLKVDKFYFNYFGPPEKVRPRETLENPAQLRENEVVIAVQD